MTHPAATPPTAEQVEAIREAVQATLVAELSDAYDCTRVWEAWNVGTMGQDDFRQTSERADEITISVMLAIMPIIDAALAPAERADLPMTPREIQSWIEACNHEPAREALRHYLSLIAPAERVEAVLPRPVTIEDLAQHLHDEEHEHGYVWPEHAADDGYRGTGAYVRITPTDIQLRCREEAGRIWRFLGLDQPAPTRAGALDAAGTRAALYSILIRICGTDTDRVIGQIVAALAAGDGGSE